MGFAKQVDAVDATGNTDEIVEHLRSSFTTTFGSTDGLVVVRAPGRVNLIGDHTDYNDGFVLPITIDRAAYVAVRPRRDDLVALYSSQFQEEVRYPLQQKPPTEERSWKNYVAGAIEELRAGGRLLSGFEMFIHGDVPLGAGLSSSAALEVAVVYGLDVLFELDLDPIEAIRLCQTVEHRYAGVECGIMDQFVSRLGRTGAAMLLDCRSLEYEHVSFTPAADGLALVIADSRVSRELITSKYGERRTECRRAVSAIQGAYPRMESLRDATPAMLADRRNAMEVHVYNRALHVVDENARVLEAAEALRDHAYDRFGDLMNQSHASLRDLFDVSCDELDTLTSVAHRTNGVLGARMTGGGFGGCTVNLVRAEAVDALATGLREAYLMAYGRPPQVYVLGRNLQTGILDGA